jgi:septum formation protein
VTSSRAEAWPLAAAGAAPVILASASAVRLRLLREAGVPVEAEAANVDEEEVKSALKAEGASGAQIAETLAELKAQKVARRHAGALVVGADQVLECDGRLFDKPPDRDRAAAHLRALAGRTHALLSAACAVRDGTRVWHENTVARLTMRPLDDGFIDHYLDAVAEDALASVGAYRLEGLGAQLFARIEGDYFSILGLPLIPLLDFLRAQGVLRR